MMTTTMTEVVDGGGGGTGTGASGWNVTFYGSTGMNYVAAFLVFKPYSWLGLNLFDDRICIYAYKM